MRTARFCYEVVPQTAKVNGCGAASTMEFTPRLNDHRQPDIDEPPSVPEKLRYYQQQP